MPQNSCASSSNTARIRPNYATGKIGSPLLFVSFHPKGSPKWLGDHVQMGVARQLTSIKNGFQIVASFPEWRETAIVLGESDPEGCAACSAQEYPQNAYRNGELFASYTAEAMDNIYALAASEHVNFLGAVTWSFEFEDQPYFAGFRELASNGVDKPVLNAFRMFGMLGDERVQTISFRRAINRRRGAQRRAHAARHQRGRHAPRSRNSNFNLELSRRRSPRTSRAD